MKRRNQLDTAIRLIIMIISGLIVVFPLVLTVMNSFKTASEIGDNILALPTSLKLDNFVEAWKRLNFASALKQTFLVSLLSTAGEVVLAGMTGYWIVRHPNKFTKTWHTLIMCAMCVPFQCIMITFSKVMVGVFHLGNTVFGVSLAFWVMTLPMSMFLVSGAVKSVPIEIEEAAQIDGCGALMTYWRIVFPMIRGTIFSIITLNLMKYWNDYMMTSFILTKKPTRTIQIAVHMLFNDTYFTWPVAVAAVTLSVLPLFIFFVIAQKQVMGGVTDGAVKG